MLWRPEIREKHTLKQILPLSVENTCPALELLASQELCNLDRLGVSGRRLRTIRLDLSRHDFANSRREELVR